MSSNDRPTTHLAADPDDLRNHAPEDAAAHDLGLEDRPLG